MIGRHPARAVDLQFGKAKSGTEQIGVTFEILEGPHSRELITWIGFLTDNAWERTMRALAVCGWPKGKSLDQLGLEDLQSLVHIVVEEEEYQGKTKFKVVWVNRPGRGGFQMSQKLNDTELRQLGAKWKAHGDKIERFDVIEAPEPGEAAEAPPASDDMNQDHPFAPGGQSDDIPF